MESGARPKEGVYATLLIVTATAGGVLNAALSDMQMPAGVLVCSVVVTLFFAFQIYSGVNGARVVFAVLYAVGVILFTFAIPGALRREGAASLVGAVVMTIVQGWAIFLTFGKACRRWFSSEPVEKDSTG